ncbi:MAG: FtsX-like permease family protein, partial [Deferribacterota bacterium]|nr:FtsX-like permease family protein [Deferribacterota bacterium]
FDMRKLSLKDGRLFTKKEAEVGSRKCILGNSVYEALFGNERAYGKNILISNVYFEVIGVLNEKGKDLADVDLDNAIYIPINTFKSRLADIESISAILVEANNPDDINGIKKSMVTLLKQNHKKAVLKEEAFNIFSLREVARAKTESINLVSLLSKMASVITFSIGGLGIFAIMLLSAYERQREIGIRMAVGATKRDILIQFLGEAIFIAFFGTLLGLILGIIVYVVFILLSSLPFTFDFLSIIYTTFISFILGVVAGIYPAIVAASSLPLKSLR